MRVMKAIYLLIALAILLIAQPAFADEMPMLTRAEALSKGYEEVNYSTYRAALDNSRIAQAGINRRGSLVFYIEKSGDKYFLTVPDISSAADRLADVGAEVDYYSYFPSSEEPYDENDELPLWLSLFVNILPLLIFFAFIFFVFRSMRSGTDQAKEINEEARQMNREFLERLEEVLSKHRNG